MSDIGDLKKIEALRQRVAELELFADQVRRQSHDQALCNLAKVLLCDSGSKPASMTKGVLRCLSHNCWAKDCEEIDEPHEFSGATLIQSEPTSPAVPKSDLKGLINWAIKQKDLPVEYARIINEDFWDLIDFPKPSTPSEPGDLN